MAELLDPNCIVIAAFRQSREIIITSFTHEQLLSQVSSISGLSPCQKMSDDDSDCRAIVNSRLDMIFVRFDGFDVAAGIYS